MPIWQKNPPRYWPMNYGHPLLGGLYWGFRGERALSVGPTPFGQLYTNSTGDCSTGEAIGKAGAFGPCVASVTGVIDVTSTAEAQVRAGPTTLFVVFASTTGLANLDLFNLYGGGAAGAGRRIQVGASGQFRYRFGRFDRDSSITFATGGQLNVAVAIHYADGANNTIGYARTGQTVRTVSGADSGVPVAGTTTARIEVARGQAGLPQYYLAGAIARAWSDAEARKFLDNPWQIYAPKRAVLFSLPTGLGAITGAASITLGAVTLASPGTVLVSGTSAVTLGAATLTAAGAATVTGAASITLGAATASSAGTVAVVGSASITLAATTSTAAGTVAVDGDAAITLGAVTLSAAGVVGTAPAIGSATITLAAQTLSAAGTVAVAGAATVTLADSTLSATGTVAGGAITGAALITLGGQTLASAGAVSVTGAASILLDSITTAVVEVVVLTVAASVIGDDAEAVADPMLSGRRSMRRRQDAPRRTLR
jgi:hypothetical protein